MKSILFHISNLFFFSISCFFFFFFGLSSLPFSTLIFQISITCKMTLAIYGFPLGGASMLSLPLLYLCLFTFWQTLIIEKYYNNYCFINILNTFYHFFFQKTIRSFKYIFSGISQYFSIQFFKIPH